MFHFGFATLVCAIKLELHGTDTNLDTDNDIRDALIV